MQYISFYDHISNKNDKRAYNIAGASVTAYVADALCRAGINVNLISMAFTVGEKFFYPGKKFRSPDGFQVFLPPSFGKRFKCMRYFRAIWHRVMKYVFPLSHISYGETVLVYHSVWLCPALHVLKKLKHVKLILQVEEVYADVYDDKKMRNIEKKAFEIADAFIFPTETLQKIVNTAHKPYVLLHGCYKQEKQIGEPFADGKIHCVYAGTFNTVKGGVYAAVDSAKFLDDHYVIHILGNPENEELELVKKHIKDAEHENGCHVIYEGFKQGEDFSKFIQSCQIGLSTQNPEGMYNATSFPSKVLMYMTHGLKVVSVDLPILRESKVSQLIEYSTSAKPQHIADAIKRAAVLSVSAEDALNNLDSNFMAEMRMLISNLDQSV